MTTPCSICGDDGASLFILVTQPPHCRAKAHVDTDCYEILQSLKTKFPGLVVEEISQQDFNAANDPLYVP